jgi:vesicular inhibitory amino acid transporter
VLLFFRRSHLPINSSRTRSDRRAQYLVAGSTVASGADISALDDDDDDDEEFQNTRVFQFENDLEYGDEIRIVSQRGQEDSFVGEIQWDEDYDTGPQLQSVLRHDGAPQRFTPEPGGAEVESPIPGAPASFKSSSSEQTPLLNKVSFSALPPRRLSEVPPSDSGLVAGETQYETTPGPPLRRSSKELVVTSTTPIRRGQSTFGQTVRPC